MEEKRYTVKNLKENKIVAKYNLFAEAYRHANHLNTINNDLIIVTEKNNDRVVYSVGFKRK